jgi:(p)ppGpp synthase/HD superfamily hydrolase
MIRAALEFATKAHKDQIRKCGEDYINHPIRVALHVDSVAQKVVALLHDTIEDTDYRMADIIDEGFSGSIIKSLEAITKRKGEKYLNYLERVNADKTASIVKRADILDNLDLSRLPEITTKDRERCYKYRKALDFLDTQQRRQ